MYSRFSKRGLQCLVATRNTLTFSRKPIPMTLGLGGAASMYNFSNGVRVESDTMGEVKVPADKLWGAQTQRSLQNFDIGQPESMMPKEIIWALGILKRACALANFELNILDEKVYIYFLFVHLFLSFYLSLHILFICFLLLLLYNGRLRTP